MNVVKEICHRMAIMQDGGIVEEGSVYELFAEPNEKLTQEFISNVVSFEVPEATLAQCTGTIVKVIFKGDIAGEGIIADTLQMYSVKGNFLHGAIEYLESKPLGIFIMELTGEMSDIHDAIQYIQERKAKVEVIRDGLAASH